MGIISALRRIAGRLVVAAAALAAAFGAAPVCAEGHLAANYEVTLAGIPIGKGTWEIDIADDQFSALASGGSSGLLSVIASGKGNGGSQGRIVKGQLQPNAYAVTISTDRKSETVRIGLNPGGVKDFSIEPTPQENPNRIPLTEAHLRGASDPMTGSLVVVPGSGDSVVAEACANNPAIFDGRIRYDLKLAFKRIENVKVEGYQGPVVVCGISFAPLAGHDPGRVAIKYLIAQRQMEIWLAPIAGTRVLAPYRLTIPTPLGTGKLEATRFVSAPRAARGAAVVPRTQ